MKTVGIIAEYNPFHTGHQYHIKKTRELTNADCVIVIMSGNYVQRGFPAIADKYTRAKAALLGGADLIIELPTIYATGSAETFAMGAISILDKIGNVDMVSFGAETNNIEFLKKITDVLYEEPDNFKKLLHSNLKSGQSMPVARAGALSVYFSNADIDNVINTPNNILALEYLKALRHFNSKITPMCVLRQGSGYHQTELDTDFASATALRECFNNEDFNNLSHFMPKEVFETYKNIHGVSMPIFAEDIDTLIYHSLISNQDMLEEFLDINNNLANKIRNYIKSGNFLSSVDLIMSLKSKEITHTRISRSLLHVLLGIKDSELEEIKKANYPGYLRVLGFNNTGRKFLSNAKDATNLAIITNLSDNIQSLSEPQSKMLELDIYGTNIYRNIVNTKFKHTLKDEYRVHPEIV